MATCIGEKIEVRKRPLSLREEGREGEGGGGEDRTIWGLRGSPGPTKSQSWGGKGCCSNRSRPTCVDKGVGAGDWAELQGCNVDFKPWVPPPLPSPRQRRWPPLPLRPAGRESGLLMGRSLLCILLGSKPQPVQRGLHGKYKCA